MHVVNFVVDATRVIIYLGRLVNSLFAVYPSHMPGEINDSL